MLGLTYTLNPNHQPTNQYYQDAIALAQEIDSFLSHRLDDVVKDYMKYLEDAKIESLRFPAEYRLELLTLGVYWLAFAPATEHLNGIAYSALSFLSRLRARGERLKFWADKLRAPLSTLSLNVEAISKPLAPSLSLDGLGKLLNWLEATGEFTQALKRLRLWQTYWESGDVSSAKTTLDACQDIAKFFEVRSLDVLSIYTDGVADYIDMRSKHHRWREDYLFVSRPEVEYHLNMVGAEILNTAFRQSFLETTRQIVLVPHCMRGPEAGCQAQAGTEGRTCLRCSCTCQVGQVAKLGEERGFQVLLITHETEALRGLEVSKASNIGVVGVACVLNLLAGGWKARSLGFSAQCVLLDYAGCKAHWHEDGIPTAINFKRLEKIIEQGDGPVF